MPEDKIISIAIAAYNGEKYIAQQIESLLNQTLLPDEIIICDDSDNDLTFNAVQKFSSDSRIKYFKNPSSLGIVENFEKAVKLCRGDYIFLCDQDDVWLPEKVEVMCNMLEADEKLDLVFCNSILTDGNLEKLNKTLWDLRKFTPAMQKKLAAGGALEVFCRRVVCSGHNIAFKRRMLEYVLPFPDLAPFYPDTWLAFSAAFNGKVQALDRILTLYRVHNANNSTPAGAAWQGAAKARRTSAAKRNQLLAEEILKRSKINELSKRKMMEKFADHHQKRSLYSSNIFIRAVQALGQLFALKYTRYSNGFRTFAADVIFRQH